MVTMSQGVYAAMQWAPQVDQRLQAWRADFNRRVSARYTPLEFLEQNERDWKDYCQRLSGNPASVPWPWQGLYEKLKTTPTLLDHLLTAAHPTPTESKL